MIGNHHQGITNVMQKDANYCKPTLILVQEIFARFARALLSKYN